ncbi:MAG: hypothetical protein E2O82_03680 [Betaproteobacteria bacterium]|nr:MAG: hypothetical protein E2O82_03680 [Betaproteobacteria bacterium]
MTMPSLSAWIDDYVEIPLTSGPEWKTTLADFIGDLVDDMTLSTYNPAPSFTFDRSTFANNLSDAPGTGVTSLANAFSAAILTSTMNVAAGTYIGVSTPATTFSVVSSVVPDPASIGAGAAEIAELVSSPKTSNAAESEFPVKLREAFLLLTYTVSGTNSVSPTPAPLVDAARSVI